jgi:sigma-B regulation protein RsbU (phosphoserine phosphatase)
MAIKFRHIPFSFLIRGSLRYLLVRQGFRLLQVVVVFAALSFVLTGRRIVAIDRLGNRADIVASILVTVAAVALLRRLNRRVMNAIDRRFFREAYNSELILTELGEAIPTISKTRQVLELVAGKINDALHPENVTIFLDDENAGAYVAAFSSNAPKASAAFESPELSLRYDEGPIVKLKESKFMSSVEFGGADVLSSDGCQISPGVRATLLIPIGANGRLNGLISLGRRLSDLPYADEDKRLLLVVANQIAAFIENMKLITRLAEEERAARELAMAAEVQRHLFPAAGLETNELDIYGTCLPALGVGGDYYDYFEMDDERTGIAIADVAGKGIAAALLMSTVQASLRCHLTSETRSLADIVSSMNHLLRRSTGDGGYVTFFFAKFDRESHGLSYVNAGHNPPILMRRRFGLPARTAPAGPTATDGGNSMKLLGRPARVAVSVTEEPAVRLLTTGGPIIGTFLDERYEQETIQLERGDVLVVYTDGVTEALNRSGDEFGEARLRSVMLESLEFGAREIAEKIIADVLEWQGQTPQHDDITLVVAKMK